MKYLGRLMRGWAGYCAVPISGMLIDTLAYQFIDNYQYRDKSFLYHDFISPEPGFIGMRRCYGFRRVASLFSIGGITRRLNR